MLYITNINNENLKNVIFFIVFFPGFSALKHSPSKRKPGERGPRTASMNEEREHIPGKMEISFNSRQKSVDTGF